MSLLTLILVIALTGFVVWLLLVLIPMPSQFKTVIIAIVTVFLLLFVLQQFGAISGMPRLRLK